MDTYSKCQLCGYNVPQGHPCMNCVDKKRMTKDQVLISPEKILQQVSLLTVKDGDIIVLKSDELRKNQSAVDVISEGITKMFEDSDIQVGFMILNNDTEILVIRPDKDK
jgi:predicted small secreted protein